jgi:23S rRNA-/tRNA-specific pseudouridylate synthase
MEETTENTTWQFNDETVTDEDDKLVSTFNATINGTYDGSIVTQLYYVPLEGFSIEQHVTGNEKQNGTLQQLFTPQDVRRLEIAPNNVTLPAALMLLDPMTYPTQSRARKAIRKKSICFSRQNNSTSVDSNIQANTNFELGKVLTRIYPGDIIGFQRRKGEDYYASQGEVYRPPPFTIPVIYEDDHMAIINKPAGIVLYRAQGGRGGGANNRGHGRDTLLSALPHVLTPSNISDVKMIEEGHVPLKRPHPVHRLDRPTSGLVVVAKTKYAAVHLARQFEFRHVKKTYMAIVNGYPTMPETVHQKNGWNIIDYELEQKSAVTRWRIVKSMKSLIGMGGLLTLVEMQPMTGRYHQLRRHLAWVCKTPLVGDSIYDNGDTNALRLRKRGLFLCSNEIEIQHPYYNTAIGRDKFVELESESSKFLYRDKDTGIIMVHACIDLPDKFNSFLFHENNRAEKFS